MMNAPQRYALQPFACVNKEMIMFNRKLQKLMKVFNHIQSCNMSLNRAHYTYHGLHMNNLGKNWITSIWAQRIKDLSRIPQNAPVIPLTWRKYCGTLQMDVDSYSISNNKDCPELLDIPQVAAKCDIMVHPPIVAMDVSHDMVNCKNSLKDVDTPFNISNLKSYRRKKPSTMRDDFLWT
jgi:hypothetical protein